MTESEKTGKIFPGGLAGIIFDCDGVMIDSENSNRYFYNTILKAMGLPPMTRAQEKYSFMATARQALLAITPEETHPRLDEIVRNTIDYGRDILPQIKLMPGFLEFVELAHDRGLRMAIDTNRVAAGMQRVLDFFHLPNYFNPVVTASVAAPKPSPEGAKMIADAWQCQPERLLFVGDSEDDRSAALGAGTRFAAFGAKVPGDFQPRGWHELGQMLGFYDKIPA